MKEIVPSKDKIGGNMDLFEINNLAQGGVVGLLIVLIGMIKIPKIELNIWNLLGRTIGRSINKEVLDKMSQLTTEVDTLKKEEELERARQARQRILRFNDEILFNKRHSKEHFDEILDDIDTYEAYCDAHEDYENNKAVLAISTIREVYKECLKDHDFLIYERK